MSYEYWKGSIEGKLSLLKAMVPADEIKGAVQSLQDDFLAFVDELENPEEEVQTEEIAEENQEGTESPTEEPQTNKKKGGRRKSPAIEKLTVSEDFYADVFTLKKAIDKLCGSYGLSYWQLQKFADIGGATWGKIVAGQTNIKGNTVAKLKKKLCIPDRLFSVENKPGKKQKKECAPIEQEPKDKTRSEAVATKRNPPQKSQASVNDDGSDPSGDEDWIKQRKTENHKRLEAEKGR